MPLVDIEALPPAGAVSYQPTPDRTGAAATAGVMALGLSLLWALRAVWALVDETSTPPQISPDLLGLNEPDPQVAVPVLLAATGVLAGSVFSLVAAANLIRCRRWAQRATVVSFMGWTLLSGLSLAVDLDSDALDHTWYPIRPMVFGFHLLVLFFATSRSARDDVGVPSV